MIDCRACSYERITGRPLSPKAARRFHTCRNLNAEAGAYALALLGAALAGPVATERAWLIAERGFDDLYGDSGDIADAILDGRVRR